MAALIILNTTIFSALALLHYYWASGGKRFFKGVLPTYPDGKTIFDPKLFSTLFIAIGLTLFALITAANFGIFQSRIAGDLIQFGNYFIGAIFLLRVIGDFRIVGITKKIRGTEFAERDAKIYIPLSALISAVSITIAIVNPLSGE